jgi:hypothetical protein
VRTMLFFRDFRRFHGGHMKVWDYFNHVLAAPGFDPAVSFSDKSRWDESNPWGAVSDRVVELSDSLQPGAFFVAGRDWEALDRSSLARPELPVVNLIQHVRHADPDGSRYVFLERPAIRICVSEEVRAAIAATGRPRGPVLTIPNGLALDELPSADGAFEIDVLVAAAKRPGLGQRLAERVTRTGRRVEAQREHLPRPEFLNLIARSRVTVFLPNEEEGFFLPALEGMAIGTTVVCPYAVGNGSFCLDGVTALSPDQSLEGLEGAVERALAMEPSEEAELRARAREMALSHSLERERKRFGEVLADLDPLWASIA